MNKPIFRSTEQALHVSYLMDIVPASVKSPMQVLYERYMKRNGIWDTPKPDHLRIDTSGLCQLEFRAECAKVRGAVDRYCAPDEKAGVLVYYAHQVKKAEGVAEICGLAAPGMRHPQLAKELSWGYFGGYEDFGARAIAQRHGIGKDALYADRKKIAAQAQQCLLKALARLDPIFIEKKWVDAE